VTHSFSDWADSADAMYDAVAWADAQGLPILVRTDADLLAGFLATPDAADAYERWADDQIADHADRQQEERRDR
jgi:hypothetical protein